MAKRSFATAKPKGSRSNGLAQVRPATSIGGVAPKGTGTKPTVPNQGTSGRVQGGTFIGGP